MAALKEVIPEINEALQYLKTCQDFSTETAYQHFTTFFRRSSNGSNPCKDPIGLGKHIADAGYGRLFPKMWTSLSVNMEKSKLQTQGYRNLTRMLLTFTNWTDVSPELGLSLGKVGGIQLLLGGLKQIKAMGDQGFQISSMKYILMILHNAIRLNSSSNLTAYRDNNAVPLLKGLLKLDKTLQVLSLMVLAYVVDDTESEILATAENGARFLIEIFNVGTTSSIHQGKVGGLYFSVSETLDAINHLAINDDMKGIMAEKGAVPCIIRMLEDDFSPEEQLVAVEALWNLAFIDKIRQSDQIQGVVPKLRTLMKTRNKDLQRMCQSALWQIRGSDNSDAPRTPPPSYKEAISEPDPNRPRQTAQIMLSYQWDNQTRVLKIKERLLNAGYRVWMDLANMRGDILGAMAEAVEESDVILICMTEKYKNSKSCRAEATYAYKEGKKLLPLLMEQGYKPDGWLGLLQGMDLYYNFQTESQLKSSTMELLKAIGECTRSGEDLPDGPIRPTQQEVQGAGNRKQQKSANEWSTTDVQSWLKDKDLTELCGKFSKFNGKHLRRMHSKCAKDDEKFEEELKRDYKLNAAHCTQFIVALEDAFE